MMAPSTRGRAAMLLRILAGTRPGRGHARREVGSWAIRTGKCAKTSSIAEARLQSGIQLARAEGVGFEPTSRLTTANGFRDRPVQPLRHPSGDLRLEDGRERSQGSRRSAPDPVVHVN